MPASQDLERTAATAISDTGEVVKFDPATLRGIGDVIESSSSEGAGDLADLGFEGVDYDFAVPKGLEDETENNPDAGNRSPIDADDRVQVHVATAQ
ncbi:hypothetical protein PlfCFBP13513_15720 [Plantibacter flavus]|nr:hypothetical protein PlfCFBP13513_15720 [Plantibacter flavus]